MNPQHPPQVDASEAINNPFRSDRVAGFRGRDTLRGVPCIVLKGEQLPGGDGCIGIYNDIFEELVTEDKILYILGEKTVLGSLASDIEDSPLHTWDDGVPIAGTATMKCVPLDRLSEWTRDDVEVA